MKINQLQFIEDYLNCNKFKTNNNNRSKLFLASHQGKLESYLEIDHLFLFLLEISENDKYNFIYKFTYDYFFENNVVLDEVVEEVVYNEHKVEREATSQKLRQEVLKNANGKCFFECTNESFYTNQGEIYLEIHHCIPLSYAKKHGLKGDFKENLIAVCPTCHRRLHFEENESQHKLEMFARMFQNIEGKTNDLYIASVNMLIGMYK